MITIKTIYSWKRAALTCAVMMLSSTGAAPSWALDISKPFNKTTAQPIRDKWAVIVGVGQYQDPAIPAMRFADRSAVELARILRDPQAGRFAPDHVLVLTSEKANKKAIEDAIVGSGLVKKALPNDLIVLYFSTRRMAGANGDPVLCASDTLGSEADTSGLDLKTLLADLRRRVQSKRILCLLDTAPAGPAGKAPTWDAFAKAAGVTVLAANDSGEPPCEIPQAGTSAFLHYFVEGLKAGGGMLSFTVVSQYTADSVRDESKARGGVQATVLAVAPEDSDIAALKLGTAVKSSAGPTKVAIGHSVDELAMKRPDLVRARNKPAQPAADEEEEDDDEQSASAVDFGPYMTEMKKSIQKRWQPPKGFENRHVVTVFTIARDGSISQPSIVESSGVPAVDQTALDALEAASPLPPLPLGAPKSVQIRYQFDWRVNRK